ncbi:hypothetical protein ACQ4PT_037644 [Festuca glaucescens]
MESSQRNGLRTPFQDLTNTGNAVQRPDPKELKRQQERERYARNKDEINKKWRESREQKKATSAILKENQTPSKTSLAISLGIPTVTVPSGATPFDGQNSLQSKQTASSNKENLHCDYYAIGSSRGCGLQPPNQALSSLEDKQALKRERENLRYELNKDVILQRLRETCHRKKAKCVLTSGEHTQLDTPVSNICATGLYTGKSAVIQLHQTPNIEDITTAGLQSFAPPIEQPIADEDCDWLHRNDTYQMQKIGGRMRPVNIPNAKPYIDTPMEKYIGNDHGEDAYGILEYLGSPLDYQTGYYINGVVEDFGQLSIWHNPREDPAPANGNPHPMFGPELTAEQLFQQQLTIWLQQNMQFGGNNAGNQHVQHMQVPDQVVHPIQEDNNIPHLMQLLQDPPLYNFQHVLAEQGVHFSAGVHPPHNSLTDSPMQAWNDSISSSSSSGGSGMSIDAFDAFQINSFTVNSFTNMHAEIWARISLVKAVINSFSLPSVNDNSRYLSISVELPQPVLFEMMGEYLSLTQNRELSEDCLDTLQHGEAEHPEPDEEARIFIEQDVAFESYQLGCHPSRATPVADTEEFVYRNLPKKHHVLKKVLDCQHCGALRFPFEGLAFCCRKGKVGIITPEVPKELKRFFTSQEDADAKYFRENIWYFNSHFSFTSLGVTLDRRVSTAARTGVYTFRACGGLYHAVDDLVPSDNGPRNLQLYIYDTDENLIHRAKRSPYLNIDIIRKILGILECNPYAQVLKSLGSVPNLDEYRISLNIDINLDQRRYNTPTTSQVAAIWVEGSDPQNCFDRSVVVHGKGDRPLYIREYYGCYDPLSCPLFFPCGETSWNLWMPYVGPPDDRTEHSMDNSARQQKQAFDLPTYDNLIREEQFMNFAPHKDQATGLPADNNTMQEPVGNDARHEDHATDLPEDDNEDNPDEDFGDNEVNATQSRKFVSAREYYCFKLQVRKKLFNIILFGGRLFQQWAVDMYIKIETMRLDWYSKPENQKVIRADLYQVTCLCFF